MRVTFICMRAQTCNDWHQGSVIHAARIVPVVEGATEACVQSAEPPSGSIELDEMTVEHFAVGHTDTVHFEELLPESIRHSRRNESQAGRD